ncbi:putative ankyrin repeat protein [Pseudolycoriella hygida]|uniref:Ankyrin repeat protein n=1 Tax=Pseudolycoriella hygida TaxID=35572 RepID=A0A9Q0N9G9_9DIPT|nr:putative ankyrin repeat protein [Pseudolycoriella hygida]
MIDNRSEPQSNDEDILELTNIVGGGRAWHEEDKLEEDNAHSQLAEELLQESLISDKSAAETTKIFQHFSKTAREIDINASNSKGKTLEDIVVEMIRPQLNRAYSDPPPLPSPTLPQLENDKVSKHKEDSQETDSLMKEIQQFMPSKKTDDQVPEPIKPASTQQDTSNEASKEEGETDSFIDLGNNKLPILDNTLDDKKKNNQKESDQLDKIPSQKTELDESSKNNNNINNNSSTLPPTENQNIENQDTVPLKPVDSPILPKPQIAGDQTDSLSGDNKSDTEVTTTIVSPVTMPDKEKSQVGSEDNKEVATPNLDILPSLQEKKPTEPQAADPIIPVLPKENTEPKMTKPDITPILTKDAPVTETPQTQTPVPVFVKKNKQPDESSNIDAKQDSNLVEEEKELDKKQPNKATPIAKTSAIKEISPEMALFIEDEKQMLFLPDDDIVLGKLTEEARLNQMPIYAFIQMFKRIYDTNPISYTPSLRERP